MMEKSHKSILSLMAAIVCQFIILFGVMIFNQHFLMGFPIVARAILMIATQWLFLIVPITFMYKNKEKTSDIGF